MTTSAYFETRMKADPRRAAVWREIARYLQRWVPETGAVADLGAGHCGFINAIRAREKHAVDPWEGAAAHAAPGVLVHRAPAHALEFFKEGTLDAVFASNLLEHLDAKTLGHTLAEIRRTLRPGGRFLIIQPNFRYAYKVYFDDYTHEKIYTHESLKDTLLAAGVEVEHVEPRFLPFSFKSRLPASPWLVRLYLALPWRPLAGQMFLVARKPV